MDAITQGGIIESNFAAAAAAASAAAANRNDRRFQSHGIEGTHETKEQSSGALP